MIKGILVALSIVSNICSASAQNVQMMSIAGKELNSIFRDSLFDRNESTVTTSDRFQQIVDLANQGQAATFSDLEGVHTGRCYDVLSRNLPRSSALLVTRIPNNNGPLFPSESLIIEGGYSSTPDAADLETKEKLTSDLMTLRSTYSNQVENPLSVVMNDTSDTSHRLAFFKSQNYFFGLNTANQDQTVTARGGGTFTVKKGDVWFACYYFMKK